MRILKIVLKIILIISLLIVMSLGVFHLWEHATGFKYVKYLKENSETIPLDQSFTFEMINKDIESSKLILVGEIHGFKEPQNFDVNFFKYLHENHSVNHYLVELDYVQSVLLNEYLESGDESLLEDILKKWVVAQGRNNMDYFNKYREFYDYYQQLPVNQKFKFIGVDRIQDLLLTLRYINEMALNSGIDTISTVTTDSILNLIRNLKGHSSISSDTMFILSHIESNLRYIDEKMNRGQIMFENFSNIYRYFNLKNSKLYGYFGLFHVFQYMVNNDHPLASLIRQSELGLDNKILSINFLINDSYMVMPSRQLPEFMRDDGKYTRMPVSADNLLFMYVIGIKDFKRMTPEAHKSLIKLNGNDSPYAYSNRMNTMVQILPVTDLFEMNEKGKPYVQYTVFVRNSDWAEPMVE